MPEPLCAYCHPVAEDAVLTVEDDAGVRLLTLNRPETRNAFNDDLYHSVRRALEEASADSAITVCVITGAGDIFSAGQDLNVVASFRDDPQAGQAFGPFARALAAFDKPLIAAVNGAAVGVGTTLLLHCDLVLVSDTARFKLPFVALGLVPEAGSSLLLPEVIGPQAAAHLLLTGDWLGAEEAVTLGLAWRRFAPERLLEEAVGVARRIAAAPLESVMNTKRLLQAARAEPVAAAIERELAELDGIVRRLRGATPPTG
jgi:enoyl-CoA hydratase/carnithine racemase